MQTNCGTFSYQAPEQIGLLPRAAGNSYNERVDIWALGAIVHQLLTSEIPFLDESHELEDSTDFLSDLDMGPPDTASSPPVAMVNMTLLADYCRNLKPFPTESLEKNGVSKGGIGFVRQLMIANPASRVCAAEALRCEWLSRTQSPALVAPRSRPAVPRPPLVTPRLALGDPRPLSPERVQRLIPTEISAPAWQVRSPQASTRPVQKSPTPAQRIAKSYMPGGSVRQTNLVVPARQVPRVPADKGSPRRFPVAAGSPRKSLGPARQVSVKPPRPPALASARSVTPILSTV